MPEAYLFIPFLSQADRVGNGIRKTRNSKGFDQPSVSLKEYCEKTGRGNHEPVQVASHEWTQLKRHAGLC